MKKIASAIALVMVLLLSNTAAFAMEIESLSVLYDADSNIVTVSGVTPYGEESQVAVYVTVGDAVDPFYMRGLSAGEGGGFSLAFQMDEAQDESGMYTVAIGGAGLDAVSEAFLFVNTQDGQWIVQAADNVQDADEMEQVIKGVAKQCGIEFDTGFSDVSPTGQASVYSALTKRQYKSAAALRRAFEQAVAAQLFNEATPEEGAALLKEYAATLELALDGRYADIQREESKSVIYEALMGNAFSGADTSGIVKAFLSSVYVALFNELDTSNRELCIDYIKECNDGAYAETISLQGYNALNDDNRLDAIKAFIRTKDSKPFITLRQVEQAFAAAVKKATPAAPSSLGPSDSGGGSTKLTVAPELAQQPQVTAAATPTTKTPAFSDLGAYEWAAASIEYLAARKIVQGEGNGNFAPERAITREEFVKILVDALDIEPEETGKSFEDVAEDAWYRPYVMTAAAYNLVQGVDYGVFGVGTPITRQQLCTIVYRAMLLLDIHIEDSNTYSDIEYADSDQIAEYARDAVETLSRAGIVSGVGDGMFMPEGEANRAMAARIMHMLLIKGGVA